MNNIRLTDEQRQALATTSSFIENDIIRGQIKAVLERMKDRMPEAKFKSLKVALDVAVNAFASATLQQDDATYAGTYNVLRGVQSTFTAVVARLPKADQFLKSDTLDTGSIGDMTVLNAVKIAIDGYIATYEGKSPDQQTAPPPPPF